MGWPYHFVDLTDEQKNARRANLDYYATLAQITIFIPLAATQCYFILSRFGQRRLNPDGTGSPNLKNGRHGKENSLARAIVAWKTLAWRCGDPVDIGDFYVGRIGDLLAAAVWLSWLLLLCFLQTGDGMVYGYLSLRSVH